MSEAILEALCTIFDQLGLAVVILSLEGGVQFANQPAKEMLGKCWPVRLVDGHLQGNDRAITTELRQAIDILGALAEAAETQDYEICLAQSSLSEKGALGCLRLLPRENGEGPAIALFITETGQTNQYGIDALAKAYGLSKAETRVLRALVEAKTPADVAIHLGLAVSTVKSHIRKIFSKTNTSRQAELLCLVECCRTPLRKVENEEGK
jgi:DNA-binding CsgD family transcriptional regulator